MNQSLHCGASNDFVGQRSKIIVVAAIALMAFSAAWGKVSAAMDGLDERVLVFAPEGGFVLGANFWGSSSATRMWQDWNEGAIAKDLDVLKAHGFTYLRVFPRWDVFQPIWEAHTPFGETYETYLTQDELPRPETPAGFAGVDERMMERFEAFCGLCEARGLKLIVCLMTGQMTFRIFTPQALERRDLYSDPVALKWERRFVDYFVTRMKHSQAIVAWESGNETCCLGPIASPDAVEAWLALIHGTIRLADPTRPVIGPNTLDITSGKWRIDRIAPISDVLAVHPYNMWTKAYLDDGNGIRNSFFATSCNVALEQIGGKPAFVEEHGIRRAECMSKANLALYARGLCWNLWSAGCRSLGWWCAFDQDNQMIPPYDWKEPCLELGAFKSDRTPYPVVKTFGSFLSFVNALPFKKLPAPKTDCVILVRDSDMVNGTYVLARQAGLWPRFADPLRMLPESSVYFLPDAKGRAFLTLRRWEELKAKVREGATLAISWNDTFLTDHEAVFGVEIESRTPSKPVFRPITAEVLERDGEGRPYLMRNSYGRGSVYLLTRPLATAANNKTGGFDSDDWKYYAKVCPKVPLVEDGARDVTISEHQFDDGSVGVVLVNNSIMRYVAKPTVAAGWTVVSAKTDDPSAAIWENGTLRLDGNAGIFFMLERTAK